MRIKASIVCSKVVSVIYFPFKFTINKGRALVHVATSRPFVSIFICFMLVLSYLAMYNKKFQEMLLSIPYEKIGRYMTSQRMVTFYVSIAEVFIELVMTIIFAGVSLVITIWLLFEEATERRPRVNLRKQYVSEENVTDAHSYIRPISRKDIKTVCSSSRLRYVPKELEGIKSFN